MKKLLLPLFVAFSILSISFTVTAQSYSIITIAGTGATGYNGDNIQATSAQLNTPYGIGIDAAGNTYTADYYNQRVRKRSVAGVITTIAGTGVAGFSGDGGQATAAQVSQPADVWPDAAGNIYIADEVNDRVRKINTAGIITTIAGNGVHGYNGDNIQATAAALSWPFGVHVDGVGNIYIAEYGGSRVRKISASTGIITTIGGTGVSGYNGDNIQATAAQLGPPLKVYLDAAGNVYIADYNNDRIRKITVATGIITTIAGTGVSGYSGDGGQATAAQLVWPFGVGTDAAGNVYIADLSGDRLRKVTVSTGIITTIAGNGVGGFNGDGSPATTKEINWPTQACTDAAGNIYISEYSGQRDRELTNVVLPVELTSFTANYVQENNSVLCQWEVATQTNNKQFTVEKTTDLQTWKEVGVVQGAGTYAFTTNYTLTDYQPGLGTSYYRLTQTDFDGKQTEYSPVAVNVNAGSEATMLYPNPVNESATLAYYSANSEPVTITIMDAVGRIISSQTQTDAQKGANTVNIPTSGFAKGIYFMRITSSSQNSCIKFIKD